jgi:hypothetical protein
MEPVVRPAAVSMRVVWIVTFVLVVVVAGFIAVGATVVLGVLRMMDRSDAHVCGLAAVRRSPLAAALLGTPIAQRGVTAGSSSSQNGELSERVSFTVEGPRGSAFVIAQGHRSPLDSHLDVRMGRDQRGVTIYSGAFACPELRVR